MKKEIFKKIKLPDKPGVYFFLGPPKRSEGGLKGNLSSHKATTRQREILYIGKATSLQDRVKSYFSNDLIETRGQIILDMLFKANDVDWVVTDSVLEALILEANLIKKYQPKYNTKEKSDKSFNYVCITKEKLPKVVIVRGKNLKGGRFLHGLAGRGTQRTEDLKKTSSFQVCFGPFPNSTQLKEALKLIRKIFPFLDDKSKNYMEFYKQINLVPDLDDKILYLQNIKNIKLFFEGKKKKILQNLKKEMSAYAKMHEFEKAGEIKRQIFALQHINDVALIKQDRSMKNIFSSGFPAMQRQPFRKDVFHVARIEAYDVAHMGGKNMVGVMTVLENGEVEKSEYKKFKIKTQTNANDTGALAEILERRLAHKEWHYPSLIVVDGGIAQVNVAMRVLRKMNIKIPTVSVVKDDRHKPKSIIGDEKFVTKYKREILLVNSEAHRFAINYHKNMRNRNFLI